MKYSFLLIFLCSPLLAADFPTGAELEILNDFSGGLNTSYPAHKIAKNFTSNMRNVFVHRNLGKLKKRNGYVVAGSTFTLQKITYGFTFNKSDGSKEFIVTDSSQVLSTKDYLTYTFISSGLNSNANLECAQLSYKVYCTNGSDPVFNWDGTVMTILDGTKGTPNIPKGKYIAPFLSRIWIGNTTADPSSLDWSAVSSTNGTIIAPDNFLAWPAANNHKVGQGDGEAVNALWIYRGQLQIGKDKSIFTEYGDRDSNFLERKIVSQAGVTSQDSVVVLDGLTYYKGIDGIYAYDGYRSDRISDLIKPDVSAMADPTQKVIENSWDIQSDFGKGSFYGSTATVNGLLQPITAAYGSQVVPADGDGNYFVLPSAIVGGNYPPVNSVLNSGTSFYGPRLITFTNAQIPSYGRYYVNEIKMQSSAVSDQGCLKFASATIVNTFTNDQTQSTAAQFADAAGSYIRFKFSNQYPLWDGFDLQNSSLSFKVEGCNAGVDQWLGGLNISFINATTVQFVSDVSTFTALTAWSNYNSIQNTNLGTITHFIRTSTSTINISSQIWQSITPGVVINAPTVNKYIQWASTITSVSTNVLTNTNIDKVTIDHIEGSGASNRAFATDWNNEYWLTVSTDLTSNLRLQYVKSWITNPNPNAWNVLSGYNIGGIWKDGNTTLYGGSSSTGTIFRLDYGTNDNGNAIEAFYETPELTFKGSLDGELAGNWMEEQVHELWIDADSENGNTFRLGTSLNGGAYTEDLIDLTGTNRILYVLKNPNKFAKYFKYRFRNNQLDHGLNLNNFAVLYTPLKTR